MSNLQSVAQADWSAVSFGLHRSGYTLYRILHSGVSKQEQFFVQRRDECLRLREYESLAHNSSCFCHTSATHLPRCHPHCIRSLAPLWFCCTRRAWIRSTFLIDRQQQGVRGSKPTSCCCQQHAVVSAVLPGGTALSFRSFRHQYSNRAPATFNWNLKRFERTKQQVTPACPQAPTNVSSVSSDFTQNLNR